MIYSFYFTGSKNVCNVYDSNQCSQKIQAQMGLKVKRHIVLLWAEDEQAKKALVGSRTAVNDTA